MKKEFKLPPQSEGQRVLACILFTDAVSFSKAMGEDEERALAMLREDTNRMHAICVSHGGSVLKFTGDGLLMYFQSAVQAVNCALKVQKTQAEIYKANGPGNCLQHRIGIHLGDVILAEGDVMGDGVNIAARLQTEARTGGVCISQTVYDVVKNKIVLKATCIGPRELKNISEDITVYQVEAGDPGATETLEVTESDKAWYQTPQGIGGLSAAGFLLIVIAGIAMFTGPADDPEPPPVVSNPEPPASGGPAVPSGNGEETPVKTAGVPPSPTTVAANDAGSAPTKPDSTGNPSTEGVSAPGRGPDTSAGQSPSRFEFSPDEIEVIIPEDAIASEEPEDLPTTGVTDPKPDRVVAEVDDGPLPEPPRTIGLGSRPRLSTSPDPSAPVVRNPEPTATGTVPGYERPAPFPDFGSEPTELQDPNEIDYSQFAGEEEGGSDDGERSARPIRNFRDIFTNSGNKDLEEELNSSRDLQFLNSYIKSALVEYSEYRPLKVNFELEGKKVPVSVWRTQDGTVYIKSKIGLDRITYERLVPESLGQIMIAVLDDKASKGVRPAKRVAQGALEFGSKFDLPWMSREIASMIERYPRLRWDGIL